MPVHLNSIVKNKEKENNKVRGLKKATVMIDIMMIGMLAMAKGHIINNHPENIRKLKTI